MQQGILSCYNHDLKVTHTTQALRHPTPISFLAEINFFKGLYTLAICVHHYSLISIWTLLLPIPWNSCY
jgi:hypothetical protein